MQLLSLDKKRKIFAGLSFWSFAMGATLLFSTVIQGLSTLINSAREPEVAGRSSNYYNNSWASNSAVASQPVYLRFGLTPGKSAMMTSVSANPIHFL